MRPAGSGARWVGGAAGTEGQGPGRGWLLPEARTRPPQRLQEREEAAHWPEQGGEGAFPGGGGRGGGIERLRAPACPPHRTLWRCVSGKEGTTRRRECTGCWAWGAPGAWRGGGWCPFRAWKQHPAREETRGVLIVVSPAFLQRLRRSIGVVPRRQGGRQAGPVGVHGNCPNALGS